MVNIAAVILKKIRKIQNSNFKTKKDEKDGAEIEAEEKPCGVKP